MSKITLSSLSNLQNETTAVGVINANSTVIQTAFDNTLSRDGTSPNTMGSNLDMNSNQILNLPSPASGSSPARLVDVVSNPTLILTVPPVGTSGAVVGLLNANLTFSGTNTESGTVTFTNNPVFSTGSLQFSGTKVGVNKSPTRQVDVQVGTIANTNNQIRVVGFQAAFEAQNQATTQTYFFGIDDNDSNKLKLGSGSSANGGTAFLTGLTTGFLAINSTTPTSGDRLLIEDNTGAAQLRLRYTGKTGVQLLQSTTGALTFNVQDNASMLLGTNNVIQATLFPSGGFGVGNASSDPGINNIGALGFLKTLTATATPAGGSSAALVMGSSILGIYFGSGAPTVSAPQGSIYLRSDGSTTTSRMYVNTTGSTVWTAVTTVA